MQREVKVFSGAIVEYSDDYGYLYFYFGSRVIGIPVNAKYDELREGIEFIMKAVIEKGD